ncbi:MAG: putative hemolysin containing domain [Alphaproteobacteria bacterium]|nr:putative hemolysin containing domain [Alphaproteobacteria bacterium]
MNSDRSKPASAPHGAGPASQPKANPDPAEAAAAPAPAFQAAAPATGIATPSALAPKPTPLRRLMHKLLRRKEPEEIREAIEELIEEQPTQEGGIGADERTMLHNILALRDLTVADVMVPRVDIVAISATTQLEKLVDVMGKEAHSRLPVFTETLDNVTGMVHIKDVVPYWSSHKRFNLSDIVRRVLFVAPTMPVLDMLLEMRRTRIHMAIVVDEFGGTDGLLTIEDLVEEIVGEIDDEHDIEETTPLVVRKDGTVDARARATIEEFERRFGNVFEEDERDNIDTLGGLVFSVVGRMPERGEVVRHHSGIEFEVLDVDPRRIRRLRIRNIPSDAQAASG